MSRLEDEQMLEEETYLINYFRQRELTKVEAYSIMLKLLILESTYATNKDNFISVLSEGWDRIYEKNEQNILDYKKKQRNVPD
jgi:hypothetical protein